jgi:hypothetical protein
MINRIPRDELAPDLLTAGDAVELCTHVHACTAEPHNGKIKHYLSSCHRLQVFDPSTADNVHGSWSATGAQRNHLFLRPVTYHHRRLFCDAVLLCLLSHAALPLEHNNCHLSSLAHQPLPCWLPLSRCHGPVCGTNMKGALSLRHLLCRAVCRGSKPRGPHTVGTSRWLSMCTLLALTNATTLSLLLVHAAAWQLRSTLVWWLL